MVRDVLHPTYTFVVGPQHFFPSQKNGYRRTRKPAPTNGLMQSRVQTARHNNKPLGKSKQAGPICYTGAFDCKSPGQGRFR